MCRLYAQVADRPTGLGLVRSGSPSFSDLSLQEHGDGWGIATYEHAGPDARPHVEKLPVAAAGSREFAEAVASARAQIAMVHIRACSVGAVNEANTHPFTWERWAFGHNGTVYHVERLEAELRPAHRRAVKGDTDSEIYFHWLVQQLEHAPDTLTALGHALRVLSRQYPHTSLNAVLSDGERVYSWCLFDPSCDMAKTDGGRYYLMRLAQLRAVDGAQLSVVGSSGFDDSLPWEDLGNGEIAVLEPGSPPQRVLLPAEAPEPTPASAF